MKTLPRWAISILISLLIVAGSGCRSGSRSNNPGGDGQAKVDPQKGSDAKNGGNRKREYAVPVAVRDLERQRMSEFVSTVGTVAPARSVAVAAEDSGRISFVRRWRESDYVKEGDLLARLDAEETSRAIEISRADLETAENQLELAVVQLERRERDFENAREMFRLGQISRKVFEEREFAVKQAESSKADAVIRLRKAQNQLERTLLQMDRKVVRAPMSGYLVSRDSLQNRTNPTAADSAESIVDLEGRQIGAGNTICGIVDTANVLIRCDVTSKDIAKISPDQKATAHVYSDREIEVGGDVADVSPIMDSQTKAFKVDVAVANPDNRLRPGMFARVDIVIREHLDALVVQRKVLQRRNNEDIVFVVNDEERAERRAVRIGLENPDEVEIVDGLRAGDQLVILGYETLQDGVKVKIIESAPTMVGEEETTSSQKTATEAGGQA
jgi:RND family efflux transporter MFP subunit